MNKPVTLTFYVFVSVSFLEEERKHHIVALSSFYETPKSSTFKTTNTIAPAISVKDEIDYKTVTTFYKDFKISREQKKKKWIMKIKLLKSKLQALKNTEMNTQSI